MTDTDDDWIRPSGGVHGDIYIGDDLVPAGDLNAVIALMFRAAGLRRPIVLERIPDGEPVVYAPGGPHIIIRPDPEDTPGVYVDVPRLRLVGLEPHRLAAAIVQAAERAAGEPADEEVESLAGWLDEEMDASPEELARRLLRRYRLEERGGVR